MRVDPEQLDQLLHPQFDKNASYDVVAKGLNASPGAAVGEAVFSAADAVAVAEAGRKCVLGRWETNPDDLAGMIAAEGILTSHGGKTSHAAVIARGMGAPFVCGVEALRTTVIFGMWDIIPYFVYLASLWVLSGMVKVPLALGGAVACWCLSAWLLIALWSRFH